MDKKCSSVLNADEISEDNAVERDQNLVKYLLDNTNRDSNGRLVMPLLWNSEFKHLIPQNLNLARSVLFSTLKKYRNEPEKMKLMNNCISELEADGIVQRIENFDQFLEEKRSQW